MKEDCYLSKMILGVGIGCLWTKEPVFTTQERIVEKWYNAPRWGSARACSLELK